MIAAAIPTAADNTTPLMLRDGPIVRTVNALWSYPKGRQLGDLWRDAGEPGQETEFLRALLLLVRAGVVAHSNELTFRIDGRARRGLSR